MIDWWFARERLLEENERLRRELSSSEKLRVKLTHELNSVNTELDNLHEAYDHFQGKFQRLETAMKDALGIRS